ncbi:centrosome and spindle pole-associated protein 1 [Platichthys flesus]|uniref:centrosome and spindle pole-associated protein 1 n=1 Tax=Platichthys flesus TaxID=8260 RepID=UPI002DBE34E8|nr:centrosome and spindle pole-associated protein 1 [Platichthys flesus]
MAPASAVQGADSDPDRGWGLSFLLGTDYERKKQKLNQERQLEYQLYIAEKKEVKTSEPRPEPQVVFLPVIEKKTAQEKLREERKKEFNLLLKEKAQSRTPPIPFKPGQVQYSDAGHISSPASPLPTSNHQTNTPPPIRRVTAKRDTATWTEPENNGKSGGPWNLTQHRFRRDKQEMEAPTVHDQNNNDLLWNSDLHMQDSRRRSARYGPVTSKDEAEFATGLLIGATEEKGASQMRKEQYKQELLKQIAEKKRNKFRERNLELRAGATGATDPEQKVDLEAEEMEPNPQRGPPGRFQVEPSTALRQLPGNTEPAQGVPSLGYFNDAYHRDFSNMLGEVTIPRVAGVPPPIPPTVNDIYRTPYDAAYYYYGSRNPLEPNNPQHQNPQRGWVQPPGTLYPPLIPGRRTDASALAIGEFPEDKSKKWRESEVSHQEALKQQIQGSEERKRREKEEKLRYEAETEAEMLVYNPWGRSGGGAPIKDQKGNLISDLSQMHRINMELYNNPALKNREQNLSMRNGDTLAPLPQRIPVLNDQPSPQRLNQQESYIVDLKQQMEENRRKKEKATERKKMEEENDMRRIVEECARLQQKYEEEQRRHKEKHKVNSSSNQPDTHLQKKEKKVKQEQETVEEVPRSTRDREEEKTTPHEQREKSPPIPTLRRKTHIVASRPSSGIEESKREEVNLREQMRILEEKTQKQEEETEEKVPRSTRDREGGSTPLSYKQREKSPPIPTLRRRTQFVASRPSSDRERTAWAPHSVPGKMAPPPRGKTVLAQTSKNQIHPCPYSLPPLLGLSPKDEVIRELSVLRRHLRKEQMQLEAQMKQTDRQESSHPPSIRSSRRPRAAAAVHGEAELPSTSRTDPVPAPVNTKNPCEFNKLKYRDSSSREEALQMYPDNPPTGVQTLDVQQQALLQEYRRQIGLMRIREHADRDLWKVYLNCYHHANKPSPLVLKDSLFPSQSPFTGGYTGDVCGQQANRVGSPRPSTEHQERTTRRRRRAIFVNQREPDVEPDVESPKLPTSQNEGLSLDEEDFWSLRSAPERRVSVESVATEPWLRPGTSASLRGSACRKRLDTPSPGLTHRVT